MDEIQDMALRLASPAELREMVQTLTRERDEARAELKRLRAALAKAKGEVDEIGELLDAANVPDHFVPWDEADASDRMSVQERVKALIEERDDACADAARLRRALAGEAALAARREMNRQVSQMEEGPCCAVCGRTDQ